MRHVPAIPLSGDFYGVAGSPSLSSSSYLAIRGFGFRPDPAQLMSYVGVVSLTDNSGGTANNTVQALTNPVDLPLTADDLRDDLVTNLIPELRNNFADLAAKVNEILVALRNSKIVSI